MSAREHVTAIIPAYNEAPRIAGVMRAALQSPAVDVLVVVDDGSDDDTALMAVQAGLTETNQPVLIRHEHRQGKGQAMETGVIEAQKYGSGILLFLDADLEGLTSQHVTDLVRPLHYPEYVMSIGMTEESLDRQGIGLPGGKWSGQRAVAVDVWSQLPHWCRRGWRPEAALNALVDYVHNSDTDRVAEIGLSGVHQITKLDKENRSVFEAGLEYVRSFGSAILTSAQLKLSESLTSAASD